MDGTEFKMVGFNTMTGRRDGDWLITINKKDLVEERHCELFAGSEFVNEGGWKKSDFIPLTGDKP